MKRLIALFFVFALLFPSGASAAIGLTFDKLERTNIAH